MSHIALALSESVGSFGIFFVTLVKAHAGIVQVALFLLFAALFALWLRRPRLRSGILLPMSLLLLLFVQLGVSGGAPNLLDRILLGPAYLQLLLCSAIGAWWHRSTARAEAVESRSRSSSRRPTTPERETVASWRWQLVAPIALIVVAVPIRFWRLAEYPKFFGGEYAH